MAATPGGTHGESSWIGVGTSVQMAMISSPSASLSWCGVRPVSAW
ncbi:MAG: hypothetical protein QM820_09925 [Minicystis sp.]